MNKDLYIRKSI